MRKKSTILLTSAAILFLMSSLGQVFSKPMPGETNRVGTMISSFAITTIFGFLAYRSINKRKSMTEYSNDHTPEVKKVKGVVLEKTISTKKPGDFSIKVSSDPAEISEVKSSNKSDSLTSSEFEASKDSEKIPVSYLSQKTPGLCPNCHEQRVLTDIAYCSKCGGKLD